ncbi:MAG: Stealth CR1 domain-containing protein [Polaribacter sp.]
MQNDNNIVIDAIITWVDGNDPKHKAKMADYLENKTSLDSKSVRMRYDQVNEIEFAVKSILKYAKFVRNIFIVTDNQTPDFLKDKEKAKKEYPSVSIIDHKTIFEGYHQYLPTFNSRSIETQLYKIPNLAEFFIYFNDDLLLLRKTKVEDFFKNGYPVLRGSWKKFNEDIFIKKVKFFFQNNSKRKRAGHKIAQQKGAKLVGFTKYFKLHHTPHSFRKSTIENYFNNNNDVKIENIKYRFRNNTQFTPQSLANHLEIKNNTYILKNDYQLVYFQNYKKPFWWIKSKLKKVEKDKNKLFLCMQSLDQCPEEKLRYIKNWLHNKYD